MNEPDPYEALPFEASDLALDEKQEAKLFQIALILVALQDRQAWLLGTKRAPKPGSVKERVNEVLAIRELIERLEQEQAEAE